MRSFWLDPYLWVHLAGVAVVPIALEGCLLGFAASNTLLPPWMELGLVGGIGAAPIFWMQWQRPFCIYSLMFLAVQPQKLSEEQRRILRRFKQPLGKGLSVLTAVLLLLVLWQIYQLAPIAWESAAIVPGGAVGGLLLAAVCFLLSNLFLQVPVSVAQVMLTDAGTIAATEPYPVNAVARDFTLFGIRVNQILPPLTAAPVPAMASASGTVKPQAGTSDRSKKGKPRFNDPMPDAETALQQTSNSTAQPASPQPKRNFVPVEVIDAEFRELDTEEDWDKDWDKDWDEVIVSEEESLTATVPAATPAEAAVEGQEAVNLENSTDTATVEAEAAETQPDPPIATLTDELTHPSTGADSNPALETSIVSEPIAVDKSAASAPAASLLPEAELLEPIPEPIEEQPAVEKVSGIGADMLQISSITLIETEDVSEAAAVDLAAVEVVTAEIVEDVSEDGAVPAETIESWLEEDWEEERTG